MQQVAAKLINPPETSAIRMPLSKDLREFVALLNSNEVEYLVVGAFAVAFHPHKESTSRSVTGQFAHVGQVVKPEAGWLTRCGADYQSARRISSCPTRIKLARYLSFEELKKRRAEALQQPE